MYIITTNNGSSPGVLMKIRLFSIVGLLAIMLFFGNSPVVAQTPNPVPVQFFYIPFPEDQLLLTLQTILQGAGSPAVNPVQTYISISAIANNTIIYYDHWENGYDVDIANPLNLYSSSNLGGTQIWGDGNPANGAPPNLPSDIINAGTVIILNNPVTTTNLSAIDFDGRDKIAATKTIAVSRSGWATGPNTLLSGANEVFDTDNFGTEFIIPVGENIPVSQSYRIFNYTGLSIMAGKEAATVQIDKDANGSFETTINLNQGEAYLVNGGVNVGAKVVSNNPIQIELTTGDRGEQYEADMFKLLPTNLWSNNYYQPVSTSNTAGGLTGTATVVWLYNPGTTSITVQYTTRTGTNGNNLTTTPITVSAGGYAKQVIPDGYGARFYTSTGDKFYALSATDANNPSTSLGANRTWDWGYTLVPERSLTSQSLTGLGIGRDPTSGTNPNENGNPVWVTPVGNGNTPATIYVDYDANPLTGPNTDPYGNKYNVSLSLRELDRAKVYNPGGNQTGMLVYTLTNGVKLATAWGQDPLTASASAPGLDVGTGVPPLPVFDAGKNGTLLNDNDGDGFITPGDDLLYTIVINNISRAPVPDLRLVDNFPANVNYIPNSSYFKNSSGTVSQIPDNSSGTPFPLDEGGLILDNVNALPVSGSYEVTFKVRIKDFSQLASGTVSILNTGSVSGVGMTIPISALTPLRGRIGDKIWYDTNKNGLQDIGENGIEGITVNLLDASGNVVASTTSDANGNYVFLGVLAGNYSVQIAPGSSYSFTLKNSDNQGINGSNNSDINPSSGKTDLFELAGGEFNFNIDGGLLSSSSIGDKVWEDLNYNGVQDAGEPGLANVSVKLYTCDNVLIAETSTNADGNYTFANVNPGSYYVKYELPSGYGFTSPNAGNDDLDSDADPLTGKTSCVDVVLGQVITNLDAGMYIAPNGSIGDKVWNDLNQNGIQDAGEPGISGSVVKLYSSDNNLIAQTTTDLNGNYSFNDIPSGNYYIQFILSEGYTFTTANSGNDDLDSDANPSNGKTEVFNLLQGQNLTNLDAGMFETPNSIGDFVWNDANKNGIQDMGETGVANVIVKLYNCGDVFVAQTTTNANGQYNFDNVPSGSYYVKFVLPADYSFTLSNQGGNDNADSDADETTGKTACFNLTNGEQLVNVDAGIYLTDTSADLKINKTVSKTNPNDNEDIIYTIVVTNDGPSSATNVVVKDVLALGVVYNSYSASQGVYDNTTGMWSVGTLPSGAAATLTINVKTSLNALNNNTVDLGPAKGWNMFILEDLTQPSSDTEGKLAVGRDANLANYSVGDKLPNSNGTVDVLVVGRDLTYTSGAVYSGNVVYGNWSNLPKNSVSVSDGSVRKDTVIDFQTAQIYLTSLSTQLSTYSTNGSTTFEWGQITLTGNDPFLNVFTVGGDTMSTANTFVINVPNGAGVLVNIRGANISWMGGLFVNGTAISNVLYNFYEASNIHISGIDVRGSILAPFANINFPAGVQNGQMIAKSLTGRGQFNYVLFNGNIPGDRTVVNVAEVVAVDQFDPDSSPNNGLSTEDDYSIAVLTINSGVVGGSGNPNGNWTYVGEFVPGELVSTITNYQSNNILTGTFWGKVYLSTNNGATWDNINNGTAFSSIWSIVSYNNTIYIATSTGVTKTTDNGATWTSTALFNQDVRALAVDASGNVYAAIWGFGVHKSTDNGATWFAVNDGISSLSIGSLTIAGNGDIYAGSFGNGIFKSVNGGVNWTNLNVGYPYVWSVGVASDGTIYAGTYGNGMYVSNNGGGSFSQFNTGLGNMFIYAINVDANDNVFVNAWAGGVYYLPSGSLTWTSMGLSGYGVSSIFINPLATENSNALYVGTADGKLYKNTSAPTSAQGEIELPTEFSLSQNYPNPFNPSTIIEFGLKNREMVNLSVFNVLGEHVATLANSEFSAGKHQVNFNAAGLQSGIYFYRITTNSYSATKKMLLIK